MSDQSNAGPDGASLLQANLERVFGERNGVRRLAAIQALYAEDATLFEPHTEATGHAAIAQAVETLLSSLPPTFAFVAIGRAAAHHGVGRLRWASGPENGPAAVTGTDVARFADGRIQTLHVFLDPASA
jgi:ketosteroid isomerase-like protein